MKQEKDIDQIKNKDWEKPILVTLSVSFTKEEDCTTKIGNASPDGLGCVYAGTATS